MEPQRLDIGHDQPALLTRRHRFAERRDIAAGEDIFAGEGVGRPRFAEAADRVEQHHPVGGHQVRAGAEEGVVIRSEEHTSELPSLMRISYAVFCLKKKKKTKT